MGVRAMYSGVSGLQTQTNWLDVIGNNVANVNTTAYKGTRATFADQLSQNLSSAVGSSISSSLGGMNGLQVGLGTKLQSLQTLFQQGALLTTGAPMDMGIEGSGFLVAQKGDQSYLTRAGNLTFDAAGYLVDAQGGRIQGFEANTQFTQRVLNSYSNVPGQPLTATNAALVLQNNDASRLSAIQINQSMTLPPKATTQVTFQGNLDAFNQVGQSGAILDLAPGGRPVLPLAVNIFLFPPGIAVDPTRIVPQFNATGGFSFHQVSNMSNNIAYPIFNGGIDLGLVQAFEGNYAWEQQPPLDPAAATQSTIYDSHGNPRQLTVQFYQVNDLGAGGVNPSPGPSQALYAWYAFDTTGGEKPSTANLVGGTGMLEGEMPFDPNQFWYDRGQNGALFMGDFLWFNTDGSLASTGGSGGPVPTPPGVPNFMSVPRIYVPMTNQANPPISPNPNFGSEIMSVDLNFGNFGLLGTGQRNGITGDAAGSYQTLNGVLQYQPNSHVSVASQDGYAEGQLQGLGWDQTGTLEGSFSNGQQVALAQVALANVANPNGLVSQGSGQYSPGPNAGPVTVGTPGQDGLGKIQGGSLEGSNVDLTVQLTDMIRAQRGMDASARIFTGEAISETTLTNLGR